MYLAEVAGSFQEAVDAVGQAAVVGQVQVLYLLLPEGVHCGFVNVQVDQRHLDLFAFVAGVGIGIAVVGLYPGDAQLFVGPQSDERWILDGAGAELCFATVAAAGERIVGDRLCNAVL